jgi:hypothetical protein
MLVQSLVIRLDGITAGDYLAWVRDPEPPALDQGLRSVAISAEPLGELVYIDVVWAGRPPTIPSAAAVAAGFGLTPEVVAVHSAFTSSDIPRANVGSRTDPGAFAEPFVRPSGRRTLVSHALPTNPKTLNGTKRRSVYQTQSPVSMGGRKIGFHTGFRGAAGFAGLGIIATATIGTRRVRRSQRPHRAPRPQPQT